MKSSPLERANAALQEAVYRQWRDWTSYLEAQLTLLDVRVAERQVAFERDETYDTQAQAAQAALDALPPASRALFAQLHEERRQAVQAAREAEPGRARLPDPDEVDRQALQALRDEAEGKADANGVGVVPLREGAEVVWYEVQVATMRAAPTAATYALGGEGDSMRTRAMLAGLLVVGGALFLAVWFLWPRGGGRAAAAEPLVGANGAALAPWPLRQVLVTTDSSEAPVGLPVVTDPPPTDSPPAAVWNPGYLVPTQLCLPADLLAGATEIALVSGEGRPDRVYALTTAAARPDLVLDPCGGRAPSRAAMFQRLSAPADATLGEERALSDKTAATLAAVSLTGPGDDPTLPEGQARVTVQVRAAIADWAAYAPTLLLADGQPRLPADAPAAQGGQTTLRYLVPLPSASLELAWSLTPPGSARTTRWRATLPAPPDRAAVVREALAAESVVPALRDGTLTLTVTVRNRRDVPFTLQPEDLSLARGTGAETLPLTAPAPAAFAEPLAPGATRILVLTAALRGDLTDPLVLTVGTRRFRIGRSS